jgi:hypothetical protein
MENMPGWMWWFLQVIYLIWYFWPYILAVLVMLSAFFVMLARRQR